MTSTTDPYPDVGEYAPPTGEELKQSRGYRQNSGSRTATLAYVSPAHFSNINFRGIFSFPLEKYEEWLFVRAA